MTKSPRPRRLLQIDVRCQHSGYALEIRQERLGRLRVRHADSDDVLVGAVAEILDVDQDGTVTAQADPERSGGSFRGLGRLH